MELYFVTSNKGKVLEAQKILGFPIHISELELPEIQSLDLHEIVIAKVKAAYEEVKKPVFVDDVGLFVEVWKGFPGPFIKFMRLSGENGLLLQMLRAETERRAYVKSVVGFYDGDTVHIFEGKVQGSLATEERGKEGWGFDTIFIPDGGDQTYSELGDEKKSKISHRALAMNKFKEYLNSQS